MAQELHVSPNDEPHAVAGNSVRWAIRRMRQPLIASSGILFVALLAIVEGPRGFFNYRIYELVSKYFSATGRLPPPDQQLAPAIPGSYADFTPLNLRIYQVIFSGPSWLRPILFQTYQAVVLIVGIWIVWSFSERLRLSRSVLGWLYGSTIACGATVMLLYEDKAAFFTAPLTAIVFATATPVAAGLSVGTLVAWTGLGLLVSPLAILRRNFRDGLISAAVFVATSLTLLSVAGSAVFPLVERRLQREERDPFWHSIWFFLGDAYSPLLRTLAFLVISGALLWRWLVGRSPTQAVAIGLVMTNLLVSNSTSFARIAMVVPLGVLTMADVSHQKRWAGAVSCWAVLYFVARAGQIPLLDDSSPQGVLGAAEVLYINAPLLVAIGTVLLQRSSNELRRSRQGK